MTAAGLVEDVVLAGTVGAHAASPTPSASSCSASVDDAHRRGQGRRRRPGASEHHGGRGGHLDLIGTVTAVGADSVTIKTATATIKYAVTGSSDIHKNGEAALKDLTVGDALTFSVEDTNAEADRQVARQGRGQEHACRPQRLLQQQHPQRRRVARVLRPHRPQPRPGGAGATAGESRATSARGCPTADRVRPAASPTTQQPTPAEAGRA